MNGVTVNMIKKMKTIGLFNLLWLVAVVSLSHTPAVLAQAQTVDRIVAVVNDDVITELELENEVAAVKRQLAAMNQLKLPDDKTMASQVLERLVVMRIQIQEAGKRHIQVDDEMLNRAIENIAKRNQMSITELRLAMEKDGIVFEAFRENLRDQLIINQLQQREVNGNINITEQEIDSFIKNRSLRGDSNELYQLQHILISVPEAATANDISEAKKRADEIRKKALAGEDFSQLAIAYSQGQQALEGGDLGFRKYEQLPSLFADVVLNMKVGDVSAVIKSPSGFHLIRLANKRADEPQRIVRQTNVRHILIRTSELVDSAQAKLKVAELRDRVMAGEDFAELAKIHSEDKASGSNGGDLGWVNPGVMDKDFEDAMNALDDNELSQPVHTPYGWHLIQVLQRRDHNDTETFQRNQARDFLLQRKLEPAVENWRRRLRDEAFVRVTL